LARPEAHYEVHPLEGAGHQGTDVGEGRDTGLMAVEMDYGNFHTGSYDFTNMGFSSSVHVGAWIVSCFLLLFFFSFPVFSFSSYILHGPFSCLVSFWCYSWGTFSGFLGFLVGGRFGLFCVSLC